MSALGRLVAWSLGPEVLRGEDVGHATLLVTDTVSAAVGAAVEPEVAEFGSAAEVLGGDGPSTVLTTGGRTAPHAAALLNGLAAVRLELDEGNQFAANHPSAHVLPAVLAAAEEIDASGAELLAAFSTAYEVAMRVGSGVRLRREVHPFGTAMVCGAAAGVARLRGLDTETALQAVLIATALVPASTQRAANSGATVRNAITGSCAASGVLAVELARTGTTGDPLALETVFGEVLGTSFDASPLEDLGSTRYLTRNYLKLHACSRWNHAPIEATATLMATRGLTAAHVASVEVATYDQATRLDGQDAATGFAGKHSIPYSVAARLVLGHNGIEAYTDAAAADPEVQSLMRRVAVVEDPELTALAPAVRAARVTVTLTDGSWVAALEERAPGGFDRPYDAQTLRDKHVALLSRSLPPDAVDGVLAWCAALPAAPSVRGLHRVLS